MEYLALALDGANDVGALLAGGAAPVTYAHSAAEARGLPQHVRIVGSWTDPSLTTCWQVMEGATADDLTARREHWSEFMNIEIIPVITGAQLQQRTQSPTV